MADKQLVDSRTGGPPAKRQKISSPSLTTSDSSGLHNFSDRYVFQFANVILKLGSDRRILRRFLQTADLKIQYTSNTHDKNPWFFSALHAPMMFKGLHEPLFAMYLTEVSS